MMMVVTHVRLAAIQQLYQIPSAGGPSRIETGMSKGGSDLTVQLLSVRNNHHLGLQSDSSIKRYFASITMVRALAAALSVPDDAALAVAPFVRLLNGLDNVLMANTADTGKSSLHWHQKAQSTGSVP